MGNNYGPKIVKNGLALCVDASSADSTYANFGTNDLITEFYNLQYLYENDCLKAGIEFNKSFYNDKDLEPENTLLFTLTIIPFGKTNTPNLSGL